MAKVLVVDDDRSVRQIISTALSALSVEVLTAESIKEGLVLVASHTPDVILLDIVLPDMSGLEAFRNFQREAPKAPIIFITAGGSSDTAIEAMKIGAFDYLLKPLDLRRIQDLVEQALEIRRLMNVPVSVHGKGQENLAGDCLVGRSPQMQEVYKAIGRVATQDVTVLIRGESGSGKELVARAIYHHSHRKQGQFLAVNCAALSESLLESELFGHEKGAFTGALTRRIGKFEQCSGGTLFLDEVGDMSPLVQSKVLRVLQEQRFERVGGTETVQTDVRLIAATNRDLEKMVTAGEYREDLFYRINGYTIRLPPLRAHKDDILPLLEWFLARMRGELNKDVHGISPEALDILLNYQWPGNVRQLQNVLRHALLQSSGSVLIREFLPAEIRSEDTTSRASEDRNSSTDDPSPANDLPSFISDRIRANSQNLYAESLEKMESFLLTSVLRHANGNQSKAAAMLGITRGSLRNKIRTLGISIGRHVESPDEELEEDAVADVG